MAAWSLACGPGASEKTAGEPASGNAAGPSELPGKAAHPSAAPDSTAAQSATTQVQVDSTTDSASASTQTAEPVVDRTVLVLGDSLAATGFGSLLEKSLDGHEHIVAHRKAKSSTGLSRPDFFDWFSEGVAAVKKTKPDLVLVIIGGNDGQDIVGKKKSDTRVGWNSEGWSGAYTARTKDFIDALLREGAGKVVVLGLPKTETTNFEKKLEIIRKAQQDAVAQVGEKAIYVDTTPLLADEQGNLRKQVSVGRHTDKLHAADGIHFTMTGSQYFAEAVYPQVLKVLGLEAIGQ